MLFLTVWSSYFIIGVTSANHGSPPSIITEDITVEQGQFFSALCYSTGDNITDTYWSKPDGQRVKEDQGSNVHSSQEYGQLLLTILDLGEADEGEYVCKELNDEGEMTVLRILSLRVLAKSQPKFEIPYVLVKAYEGENVTFTCEALGDQPIQYTWFDQYSSVISNSSSNPMVEHRGNRSELHLLQVSNETRGVYTCTAANHLGTNSKLFELAVLKREDLFPPFFKERNETVYGEEFQNLTLKCFAEGNPPPSYRWFDQQGDELNKDHPRVINSSEPNYRSNASIIIDVSGNQGFLIFTRLMKSDSGYYTCFAASYLGKAFKTYEVYVNATTDEQPPVFDKTRVEVYGFEDEPLTLNCQAEGNPRPTYVWYNLYGEKLDRFHQRVIDLDIWNHSLEIPHKRPSTILVSPSNGTLIFVQIKRNDAGHYACYAQNSAGRASKTYRIYVNETDVRKEGCLTVLVQNVTHDSVTFELIIDDVSAVSGFEAKYRLINERNFIRIRWWVGDEYKVTGLLPGAQYSFEFRILSSDNWTNPITVALPPGPPEIIVRQVAGNRLSMEFFRPFYMFSYNSIQRYVIKYRTVQQVGGNRWNYRDCEVTIELPVCYGNSYEISNLASRVYYSITVQAVGPGGYSEPSEMKIYIP